MQEGNCRQCAYRTPVHYLQPTRRSLPLSKRNDAARQPSSRVRRDGCLDPRPTPTREHRARDEFQPRLSGLAHLLREPDAGDGGRRLLGASTPTRGRRTHADVGVGITGSISRRDQTNPNSNPGEIYIAVVFGTNIKAKSFTFEDSVGRSETKEQVIKKALEMILEILESSN